MINVLIVDDSAIVRAMIKEVMESDIRFHVVGIAENGEKALERNAELKPDLIVMDINMPVMDGLAATQRIMSESNPAVVIFTTEDTVRIGYSCIEAGAAEVFSKPDFSVMTTEVLRDFCDRLASIAETRQRLNASRAARKSPAQDTDASAESAVIRAEETGPVSDAGHPVKSKRLNYDICLIGSSTGGPAAVQTVLNSLGADFPLPVLIAQHIDSLFDEQFAKWLDETTCFSVSLAESGVSPEPGHAYVAPANRHLVVTPGVSKGSFELTLSDEPPVHFLKPAVDKLFISGAKVLGKRAIAAILTGMGKDGADGCLELLKSGACTIAQDEESCIVFGMPRAAIDAGGIEEVCPLEQIGERIRLRAGA